MYNSNSRHDFHYVKLISKFQIPLLIKSTIHFEDKHFHFAFLKAQNELKQLKCEIGEITEITEILKQTPA